MAAMEGNCEDSGDVGAEVLRRGSVLRPLLQMYLSRTGAWRAVSVMHSESMVSARQRSGGGFGELQTKVAAPARWLPANTAGRQEQS